MKSRIIKSTDMYKSLRNKIENSHDTMLNFYEIFTAIYMHISCKNSAEDYSCAFTDPIAHQCKIFIINIVKFKE